MSDVFDNCNLMSHLPALVSTLDNWQTLASGILAVLAAAISIFVIRRQTKATMDIYNDGIARKHRAAMTLTSAFISRLNNQNNTNLVQVIGLSSSILNNDSPKRDHHLENMANADHSIDQETLNAIQVFCETLNDLDHDRHIIEFVRNRSKIEWLSKLLITKTYSTPTLDERLVVDLIISHSIASYLGNSLRKHCEHDTDSGFPLPSDKNVSTHWSKIRTDIDFALSTCNAHPNLHTAVINQVTESLSNNTSPWIATVNK